MYKLKHFIDSGISMFKVNRVYLLVFIFVVSVDVNGQALSWLSKPQHELGLVADGEIASHKISANGRYITFMSNSTNLVAGTQSRDYALYMKDLQTGVIMRVSEAGEGPQFSSPFGTNFHFFTSASDNGRFVTYGSSADNLPMANGDLILYLKDLQTGEVTADSVDATGQTVFNVVDFGALEQSSDGRYLAFNSRDDVVNNPSTLTNVFRKDRQLNNYRLVSVDDNGQASDGSVYLQDMSNNGRYITFDTNAYITSANPNPLGSAYYLRDMDFATTNLFVVDVNGDVPFVSIDNSRVSDFGEVVFCSNHAGLVSSDNNFLYDVFVFDAGQISRISLTTNQQEITDAGCVRSGYTSSNSRTFISGDGSHVVFLHSSNQLTSDDSGGFRQAYHHDLNTGVTTMISKTTAGVVADAVSDDDDRGIVSISGTGRISLLSRAQSLEHSSNSYIYNNMFTTSANNLSLQAVNLATLPATDLTAAVQAPVMSADMNLFLYATQAPNADDSQAIDDDLDLFLYNRNEDTQVEVGSQLGGTVFDISANGRYVTFVSDRFQPISTIELGDDNVFLYDTQNDSYSQIAVGYDPKVNNEGHVVFVSEEALDPLVTNGAVAVYFYNNDQQTIGLVSIDTSGQVASSGYAPNIAGEGLATWVVFSSFAGDLVANDVNSDPDVFMLNWPNGSIMRVSENAMGEGVNNYHYSNILSISEDTSTVVFSTNATNLTDDIYDVGSINVFAYNRLNDSLNLVSKDIFGNAHDDNDLKGYTLSVSDSGRYILFDSDGLDLVSGAEDRGGAGDLYLFDQQTQIMQRISQQFDRTGIDGIIREGFVQADESFDSPLVGVVFADQGNLVPEAQQAAPAQMMFYQKGGAGVDLSMQVSGDGGVFGNLGYQCQANCTDIYDLGVVLTLQAIADTGAIFLGWSGDACQDDNQTCVVVMNEAKSIQALFSINDEIFSNGFE